jgi:hypothetical protein
MRHERGLELVVAILLAAGTASVGLGIYESQSHRNAGVWWALAVMAFMAVVLVPIFWVGVRPLLAWGGAKAAISTARWHRTAALPPKTSAWSLATVDVVSALYIGTSGGLAIVTEEVQRLRDDDGSLKFSGTNLVLGEGDPTFDPAPGEAKKLVTTRLPSSPVPLEPRGGSSPLIRICDTPAKSPFRGRPRGSPVSHNEKVTPWRRGPSPQMARDPRFESPRRHI